MAPAARGAPASPDKRRNKLTAATPTAESTVATHGGLRKVSLSLRVVGYPVCSGLWL